MVYDMPFGYWKTYSHIFYLDGLDKALSYHLKVSKILHQEKTMSFSRLYLLNIHLREIFNYTFLIKQKLNLHLKLRIIAKNGIHHETHLLSSIAHNI